MSEDEASWSNVLSKESRTFFWNCCASRFELNLTCFGRFVSSTATNSVTVVRSRRSRSKILKPRRKMHWFIKLGQSWQREWAASTSKRLEADLSEGGWRWPLVIEELNSLCEDQSTLIEPLAHIIALIDRAPSKLVEVFEKATASQLLVINVHVTKNIWSTEMPLNERPSNYWL